MRNGDFCSALANETSDKLAAGMDFMHCVPVVHLALVKSVCKIRANGRKIQNHEGDVTDDNRANVMREIYRARGDPAYARKPMKSFGLMEIERCRMFAGEPQANQPPLSPAG